MNTSDPIINTALLGTAAKDFPVADFPEELQASFRELKEKAEDAEASFYQMAALGFAYFRAGSEPQPLKEFTGIQEAEPDDTAYFSHEAGSLLLSLIANRNRYLLLYAYRRAEQCGKLIHPNYLPALLSDAFDRNNPHRAEVQLVLSRLTGHRGRWLLPLMGLPVWGMEDAIVWETATHEERKRLLFATRRENPDAGLALLQTELKNESAAHREELIRCLREQLNTKDEAFLQEVVATDRSSNVKDTARDLLCSLPGSAQVRFYWELLKGKLHHNLLLGWSYDKLEFTPEMKQMGLAEVSSVKNEKDDRFLLRQLAERVPLAFWCEFYKCEPEKAAAKLAKNPPFQDLFDIKKPIVLFNDSLWGYHTLREKTREDMLINLIGLLSPVRREDIEFKPDQKEQYVPEEWYNADGESWGMKFSTRIFQRLLTRTYNVSRGEIERIAVYFPEGMIRPIEQLMASVHESEPVKARTCRILLEYLAQKQNIDTLFECKN